MLRRTKKAQALAFVLVLVAISGVVSSSLASLWQNQISSDALSTNGIQAFYLAQAGLERSRMMLQSDWDSHASNTLYYLDPLNQEKGSYTLTISGSGSIKDIVSTGRFNNAVRTIKASVQQGAMHYETTEECLVMGTAPCTDLQEACDLECQSGCTQYITQTECDLNSEWQCWTWSWKSWFIFVSGIHEIQFGQWKIIISLSPGSFSISICRRRQVTVCMPTQICVSQGCLSYIETNCSQVCVEYGEAACEQYRTVITYDPPTLQSFKEIHP